MITMDQKLPVSVIVLTYNEEDNIEICLQSIQDWADEIFVVDSGSTDDTLEIVSRYTKQIFKHPFENYSLQRNWAQNELPIKNDWVFHIDADERVTPVLAENLKNFFKDNDAKHRVSGLMISRRIEFLGRFINHGGLYPTYHLRVFKKEVGYCEERDYDQHFIVDGETEILKGDLINRTASSLESWTNRHNRWAQMEARFLINQAGNSTTSGVRPDFAGTPIERRRWLRRSILEKAPLFLRSFLYFLYRYFFRGGFLDGAEGLIYHVLHGFWFRFYIDSCIYEVKHQNRK